MNWGQFVEMFVMLLVPIVLVRFGVKWAMAVGLIAMLVRYVAFLAGGLYDQTTLYYLAILVHGIIFGFFFVGGQVYVDKKAPPEIRAQAQGLIVLICFGIGMFIGNFFNGRLIDIYTTEAGVSWNPIWVITMIISAVLLGAFCILFKEDVPRDVKQAAQPASADQEPQA
jgi:MFS family permease